MNVEENNGVPATSEPAADGEQNSNAATTLASTVIALPPPELPEGSEFAPVVPDAAGEGEVEEPPVAEEATPADPVPEPFELQSVEESSEARATAPDADPDPGTKAIPCPDPGTDPDPEPASHPEPEIEYPRIKKHHLAPALIALDHIDDDDTFSIRPVGDLSQLATDIARLGQLFPVDVRQTGPDRFQVICGFRRVAALRFLQRDRVLARLHTDLDDQDALLMALVSAIHARPVVAEELAEVKERLQREGRLSPAIRNMLEKAISPEDDLAPETVDGTEQEIDAEELAADVTYRLGEINQDLSLLADVFDQLEPAQKDELLEQLRYSSQLVAYLEGRR